MMADRGITLTHTTILRWVQRYLPESAKRWSRYARPVGGSGRMDETHIKVRASWVYLYRAVDKGGRTMLGFKRFDHAAVTISGIELAEQIKKGQFNTEKFGNRQSTMSEL